MAVRLLLQLLSLQFVFNAAFCKSWPRKRVLSVQPDNPYVLIGENLTLTCNVTSDDWMGSTLYFTHKDQNKISTKYWRSIGPNSIRLDYPITSPDDEGNYVCKANKTGQMEIKWDNQVVKVEYPPQEVKNFSCQISDYNISIFCNWNLGVDYVNPKDISITFFWMYQQERERYRCPHQTETSCSWKSDEGSFDLHPLLFFVTVVNTKTNITATQRLIINKTESIVKPKPVHEFEVHPLNSTCLHTEWKHHQHRTQVYRIQYSCLCDWDNTTTTIVINKNSTVICGLNPYTSYKVRVSAKPEIDGGFWSDETKIVQETLEDVPGASPVNTLGSMSVNSELCNSVSVRTVNIFWKSLPTQHQHGKILGYHIKYNSSDDEIKTLQSRQSHCSLVDLRCDQAYDIRVFAYTQLGSSERFALFHVNAFQSMPDMPKDIRVEQKKNSNDMFVRWTVPDTAIEHTIVSFTVYWCYEGAHMTCRKDISWRIVQENSTTIPVSPVEATDYLYGVSMETSQGSSGFQWGKCIYNSDKYPPEPPDRFHMNDIHPAESLSVTWDKTKCNSIQGSAFINQFGISYCKLGIYKNCTGSKITEKKVEGKLSSYIITGLEAGVTYGVSLKALSEAGQGPETGLIFGIPQEKSIRDSKAGWIAGTVIAFLIVFVAIIGYIAYKCHQIKTKNQELLKINPNMFTISESMLNGYVEMTSSMPSSQTQFTNLSEELEQTEQEEGNNLLLVNTQISEESGRSSLGSENLPASPTQKSMQNDGTQLVDSSQAGITTSIFGSSQTNIVSNIFQYVKCDTQKSITGV